MLFRVIAFGFVGAMVLVGASGCGCNSEPAAPAKKAAPWAAESPAVQAPAGATAAFKVLCRDQSDQILRASSIYMSLKDPYGAVVFNTTVTTDEDGYASFENVPAGNFLIDFIEGSGFRSRLQLNLAEFATEPKKGTVAGTANF